MFVCRRHPKYKAKREPMNACDACVWLFELMRCGLLRRVE